MRGANDRDAFFLIKRPQQIDDLFAGLEVEIAGRLVREDDGRVIGQRARDRHPLLLASREFERFVPDAVAEAHQAQQFGALVHGVLRAHPGEHHRQRAVFERGHDWDQIERLKDVANLAAPQPCEFIGVEARNVHLVNIDFATAGFVEPADHVEEGRFPRAGRPHDRDILAGANLDADALEGLQRLLAHGVFLGDIHGLDGIFMR